MVHPASFFAVPAIDASDCGAIARNRDAIADSRGAGERGERAATDLGDGGGVRDDAKRKRVERISG
jgi:hypothetical protein